ncbi:hypothetical protein BpHYR1_021787 [Brachionus plicatilis]|uniref:Uncharacterized protein n=1 Tax=Brachionus plicatilis TaxID=10195 RepID=A0A3M7P999_BRAPC|nr:hypothetical protein BpHYR1_021787 [Brachionus plicatilis]
MALALILFLLCDIIFECTIEVVVVVVVVELFGFIRSLGAPVHFVLVELVVVVVLSGDEFNLSRPNWDSLSSLHFSFVLFKSTRKGCDLIMLWIDCFSHLACSDLVLRHTLELDEVAEHVESDRNFGFSPWLGL